jgi:hypothetical protein
LASANEEGGKIKNCKEEIVLRLTGLEVDVYNSQEDSYSKAVGVLQRLHDNKMITLNNDGSVTINNFNKRQGSNLSGYERVKRYRDKKNKPINKATIKKDVITNDNIGDNANDNARIDKIRIEKNREEEKIEVVLKKTYSEFNNVKLTDEEHQKLIDKIGDKNTGLLIEELGGYIASTNKRYSSHYATLLGWWRRKVGELGKGRKII